MTSDTDDSLVCSRQLQDGSTIWMPDTDSADFQAARQKLKEECQDLWQQLTETQAQLHEKESLPKGHLHAGGDSGDTPRIQHHGVSPHDRGDGVTTQGDNPLLAIAVAKENLLLAQVDQYKEMKPEGLIDSDAMHYELLTESLTDGIAELKQVLSLIAMQEQEMQDEIDRETEMVKEHEEIKRVLLEKLSLQSQHDQCSETSLVNQIQDKTNTVTAYHKVLLKNMAEFVEKHFPPLTAQQLKRSQRKVRSQPQTPVWPLQQMLEVLMNKSVETPHNPYMSLEPAHWPPYVELLLRFGIAVKHPDDDQQIKLTPFHL